ncbi:class I adenylate-forming enzyme family protein [Actinokineospora sp.]|uniref:class I adenylate-forming enzyme family protein n=1 Tax=Actinokineospora sp. TaxID=1872133 RepID=UPI0040383EE5
MTGDDSVLRVERTEPVAVRLAASLADAGIRAGDRVLVLGDNSPGYVALLLALIHLDTSIVLVDRRQTADQVAQLLVRSQARWAAAGHEPEPGSPEAAAVEILGRDRVLHYPSLATAPGSAGRIDLRAWAGRRDGVVLWSSGTTGSPKGIVRPGAAMLANIAASGRAMGYTPDDVLFPMLPFSHQYGMSLVLLWWTTRCSLLVAPYLRLGAALDRIGPRGVTVVDATPPTYHTLLDLLGGRPELVEAVRSVRLWCVGGAPLPGRLAERFLDTVGRPLIDGYGLSEVGNVALATSDNPVGCGRPLDGVAVRIDDVSPDGLGEVVVRSPGRMAGLLDADGSFVPVHDEWVRTGDLGHLDPHGNLHVVGRKQAVHRMGYTLYPESLRRQAERCGHQVAVIAVDEERRGCQLVFFVEDAEGRDSRFWRGRFAALLAEYERPNVVTVLDRFPINTNGKVDQVALLAAAAHRVGVRREEGEQP